MSTDRFKDRMRQKFGLGSRSWALPQSGTGNPTSADNHRFGQSSSDRESVQVKINVGEALSAGERGAIWPIFPAAAFPGPGRFEPGRYAIPEEELRTALLFFDKFDVPTQNMFGGTEWCESELRRVGILTPSVANGGGDMAAYLRVLPFHTFEARERSEPGLWALARPAQALGFPAESLQPHSAVSLTLQNALPTFSRDVPLEDILEFKHRAKSELLALRSHFDDLCVEVGQAGTNSFEHSVVFRRFEKSLKDHIDLMNQSNRAKVWQSLKASCDLPSGVGAGAGAFSETIVTGTLDIGTLATGMLVVGIRTVAGLKRKRDKRNPFEYLTSAHLEL